MKIIKSLSLPEPITNSVSAIEVGDALENFLPSPQRSTIFSRAGAAFACYLATNTRLALYKRHGFVAGTAGLYKQGAQVPYVCLSCGNRDVPFHVVSCAHCYAEPGFSSEILIFLIRMEKKYKEQQNAAARRTNA